MKTIIRFSLATAAIAVAVFSSSAQIVPRPAAGQTWDYPSKLLTTVATDLATVSVRVCYMELASVPAATTPTVTITDKQGTPVPFFSSVPLSQVTSTLGQTYIVAFGNSCRLFSGGITASASANSTVSITMHGTY